MHFGGFLVFFFFPTAIAYYDPLKTYYAIELSPETSPSYVSSAFGVEWEGPVGQLPHHHLFSTRGSHHSGLEEWNGARWMERQIPRWRAKRGVIRNSERSVCVAGSVCSSEMADGRQWHLRNTEQLGHDLNVTEVWRQGVTGRGVIVAVIDDGIDMENEDLRSNYYAEGSYDFNTHTATPRPRGPADTHGTRCAGEIAAARNDMCGVGVAYEAKISGIRMLSGAIIDADEAAALTHAYHDNAIYTCSWGPPDDGETLEAPSPLIQRALEHGTQHGRHGKGSIYVFASGNGGWEDNCNFDGYANSIYTMTIGAIDRWDNFPAYAERCAALIGVTYSSGNESFITTTDVGTAGCTEHHGGTSAAAPLAAGIFALVLSIRPDLSWRDVQRLAIENAVPFALEDPDWQPTAAKRMFNHKFGYGKMDAFRMVEAARNFKRVGKHARWEIPEKVVSKPVPRSSKTGLTSSVHVEREEGVSSAVSRIGYVEHVSVTLTLEHPRRGDVEVLLISPSGIVSQLATPRKYDSSSEGFTDWTFTSVKHWDESPYGTWALRILDHGRNGALPEGRLVTWRLTFYGEEYPRVNEGEDWPGSRLGGERKVLERVESASERAVSWRYVLLVMMGCVMCSGALPRMDIGLQCDVKTCQQLDFLPFQCPLCDHSYCLDHRFPLSHSCPNWEGRKALVCERCNGLVVGEENIHKLLEEHKSSGCKSNLFASQKQATSECHVNGCGPIALKKGVVCSGCGETFCLKHRHVSSHACPSLHMLSAQKHLRREAALAATSSLVDASANKERKTWTPKKAGSKTSRMVELMRIKSRAEGDKSVPLSSRVYVSVEFPKECGLAAKPMFFDKTWSLGRVLDRISQIANVSNSNNQLGATDLQVRDMSRLVVLVDGEQAANDSKIDEVENGATLKVERLSALQE
ncbi:uncharacterized protein VTP21DRAFT_4037 [Calcarisporiella thermophila]|uniref:uncharacterized protein n=1 Tax=Calcarisporiella thermophila TaxID=911321 RepID=UPI0037432AA6